MNASVGGIRVERRRGIDLGRALLIAAALVSTIEAPAPVIPNLAHRPPHHEGSVKAGASGAAGG